MQAPQTPRTPQAPRTPAAGRLAAARAALRRAEQRTGLADQVSRGVRRTMVRARALRQEDARSDPWPAAIADAPGALSITGSTSVLLAAAAHRQGPHGWCAVVGAEGIGWCAAAESGLALDRVLAVSASDIDSRTLLAVVEALLDGVDVLLVSPRCSAALRARDRRHLTARARERGALLLAPTPWEGARVLDAVPQTGPPPGGPGAVVALHPRCRAADPALPGQPASEMPEGYLHRLAWSLRDPAGAGSFQLLLDAAGAGPRAAGAEPRPGPAVVSGRGA